MQIWSHRGNPGPENSLAAFDSVYKIGIRRFETDIQVTKDGVIVLSHDAHTGRVARQRQRIRHTHFAELNKETSLIASQEPWCSLDELVASFPDVIISIDLKSDESVPAILRWLKGRNYDNLIFGSFRHSRVMELRSVYPWLNTSLTPLEVSQVMLGIPISRKRCWGITRAMVPENFKGLGIVKDSFVDRCHEVDIEVHVWVVNSLAQRDRLQKIGVDGIVTDDCELFLR